MITKLLFSAFIIVTSFCSCATYRYIYSASPPNNPYFTKKGESKLTAYYSSSTDDNASSYHNGGIDLHGAYAISNHLAVTIGYFGRREHDMYAAGSDGPFDNSKVQYKRNLIEAGGGYFIALNRNKTFTANLYAGVASGKFLIDDNGEIVTGSNYTRYHKSNITKWFFQPSINFLPSKNVRLSLILKSNFVHYGNIKTSYTDYEMQYFHLDEIKDRTLNFIEPAFNIQFGISKIPWLKLDYTASALYNNSYTHSNIRQNNASIGLSVDFSKMKKRK